MKVQSTITKKTMFILVLILVASMILGYGIKGRLSQQNRDGNYPAPTPQDARPSIWDVFDEEEQDSSLVNQTGESSPESGSIEYHEPIIEPTMLDSDFVWFGSRCASCYDTETDIWLVYEAGIGDGIYDNRTIYRYNVADMCWESFASQLPHDVWMIRRLNTWSADQLYLNQWNTTTREWVEHTKKGYVVRLGTGHAWFNDNGTDCYRAARKIESTISVQDNHLSCAVNGGIPPLTYSWTSDRSGLIGDASSFEMELPQGTHNITLVITDASGSSTENAVTVQVT